MLQVLVCEINGVSNGYFSLLIAEKNIFAVNITETVKDINSFTLFQILENRLNLSYF